MVIVVMFYENNGFWLKAADIYFLTFRTQKKKGRRRFLFIVIFLHKEHDSRPNFFWVISRLVFWVSAIILEALLYNYVSFTHSVKDVTFFIRPLSKRRKLFLIIKIVLHLAEFFNSKFQSIMIYSKSFSVNLFPSLPIFSIALHLSRLHCSYGHFALVPKYIALISHLIPCYVGWVRGACRVLCGYVLLLLLRCWSSEQHRTSNRFQISRQICHFSSLLSAYSRLLSLVQLTK